MVQIIGEEGLGKPIAGRSTKNAVEKYAAFFGISPTLIPFRLSFSSQTHCTEWECTD